MRIAFCATRLCGMARLVLLVVCGVQVACVSQANLIAEVIGSRDAAMGLVGGYTTELEIMFFQAEQLNPQVRGLQIPAGGRLDIELLEGFERNGVDNSKAKVMVDSDALLVLGTGLAQNLIYATKGIGVQHGNYRIEDDGRYKLSIIPNGGGGSHGLENARANRIGFKSVQLRANGSLAAFTNGPIGSQAVVSVQIVDAAGNIMRAGKSTFDFAAPLTGLVAHVNNEGYITPLQSDPMNNRVLLTESVDFQRVGPSSALMTEWLEVPMDVQGRYALQFILFDANQPDPIVPLKGMAGLGWYRDNLVEPVVSEVVVGIDQNRDEITDPSEPQIGVVSIAGPAGSRPVVGVFRSASLTTSGDGITGAHGSTFRVMVELGHLPGVYKITLDLSMSGGGIATSYQIVE